jgi:hypothetical protein
MKNQIDQEMRKTLNIQTPQPPNQDDYALRHPQQPDIQALKTLAQTPQINISALPIKANLNATISVMLNGAVVARALVPFFYDLFTKMAASTGTRPKGTTR